MSQNQADHLRDEAYRRYRAGDSAGAEQICRRLLQHEAASAEVVYLLGVIAQDAAQLPRARDLLVQAASIAPQNAVFRNAVGEVELLLGSQSQALDSFRRAIAL